jgi:hypothetical protein
MCYRKNTETVINASKEVGVEAKAEKLLSQKCMAKSLHEDSKQIL